MGPKEKNQISAFHINRSTSQWHKKGQENQPKGKQIVYFFSFLNRTMILKFLEMDNENPSRVWSMKENWFLDSLQFLSFFFFLKGLFLIPNTKKK